MALIAMRGRSVLRRLPMAHSATRAMRVRRPAVVIRSRSVLPATTVGSAETNWPAAPDPEPLAVRRSEKESRMESAHSVVFATRWISPSSTRSTQWCRPSRTLLLNVGRRLGRQPVAEPEKQRQPIVDSVKLVGGEQPKHALHTPLVDRAEVVDECV